MLSSRPTHLQLNRQILCSGLALVLLLSSVAIQAQLQPTSQLVSFAGTIPGQPDGPVAARFRLYNLETGGVILFEETQTVTVAAEKFTVRIGDATVGGIPALVFHDNPSTFIYVALDVTPEEQIGPRTPITSSGYAHFASSIAVGSVTRSTIVAGAVDAVAIDSGQVQVRVSGLCNPGSAIRQVDQGGTVVCQLTGGGGIGGSGTVGTIPKFTAPTMIGDSHLAEEGSNVNIVAGNMNLPASTATAGNILKNGALFIHSYGPNNFFAGVGAGNLTLSQDPEAGNNTGVGVSALSSLTFGRRNTAVGSGALSRNTSGQGNTAIGASALFGSFTGFENTAIGYQALFADTSGNTNTAIGYQALLSNTEGDYNTAIGDSALENNDQGQSNTAIGVAAGLFNRTGSGNSFFGHIAGRNNTTGFENAFFGRGAGLGNTMGFNNAFFGDNAGFTNTTGSNNTAIGVGADVGDVGLTNATAIGAGARVITSNTIQLGSPQVTKVVTNGVVTAGGFHGLCVFSTPLPGSQLFCDQDVAETFATLEATEPGDLVVLVNQAAAMPTVRKSTRPYEGLLLGAVSTSPGLVFDMGETRLAGDNSQLITPKKTVIGLVGRVPVKVSLENGAIAVGDPITSSSTMGVAMKATRAGQIIGYALGKADEKGKVLVHLQPGYYIPPQQLALLNEINEIDELKAQVSELQRLFQTVLAHRGEGSLSDVAKSQAHDKARLTKAAEENQEPQ